MSKKILLAGASGLVGKNILQVLNGNESELILLSRKKLQDNKNIKELITNFDNIGEINYQETINSHLIKKIYKPLY